MRNYLIILFICLNLCAIAQIGLGPAMLPQLAQGNQYNPAFFGEGEFQISLPSFYGGYQNQHFKLSEVLSNEGNVLTLDMQNLQRLGREDGLDLQSQIGLETFGFAYQHKNWRIAVNQAFRMKNLFSMNATTAQFLLDGNAAFIGETVAFDVQQDLMIYNELSLGLAYRVLEQFTIGSRLKYLSGIAGVNTSQNNLRAQTDAETFDLSLSGIHQFNTAGLYVNDGDNESLIQKFKLGQSFFNENNGLALDFGLDVRVNEWIDVSASVINLGKIDWVEETKSFVSSGNRSFDGFSLEPLLDATEVNLSEFVDSINTTFAFEEGRSDFETQLPAQYYLHGRFQLRDIGQLAVIYGLQTFKDRNDHSAAINLSRSFGKNFNLGAQYSYYHQASHALGLHAIANVPFGKWAGAQIYFMTDNVLAAFDALNARAYNMRVGVNLTFNTVQQELETDLAANEATPLDSTIVSNQEIEAKNKFDRRAQRKKMRDEKRIAKEKEKVSKAKREQEALLALQRAKELQEQEALDKEKDEALLAKQRALLAEQRGNENGNGNGNENGNQNGNESGSGNGNVAGSENTGSVLVEEKTLAQKKLEADAREAERLKKELSNQNIKQNLPVEGRSNTNVISGSSSTTPTDPSTTRVITRSNTSKNSNVSTPSGSSAKVSTQPGSTKTSIGVTKRLTDKTSLRVSAASDSKVMLRFRSGDKVNVLEKTNKWWWLVEFNGQIGYVKARLLKD